jgi:hypothetical protein
MKRWVLVLADLCNRAPLGTIRSLGSDLSAVAASRSGWYGRYTEGRILYAPPGNLYQIRALARIVVGSVRDIRRGLQGGGW